MPSSLRFAEILAITDPEARIVAELDRLDAIVEACRTKSRWVSGKLVSDPDSAGMVKAEDLAYRLIAAESERRGVDRPGSADQTRAEAIAELRATLAVWEDPTITDEQWAASRWKPKPPKQGGGATKKPRRNPL
jgi:hypothetical protein